MSKIILTLVIILVLALIGIFIWPKPFEEEEPLNPIDNSANVEISRDIF